MKTLSLVIDPALLRSAAGKAVTALKLLANEDRLLLLCQMSQGEMCVSDLEQTLGIHQPTLSQQLGVLRNGAWSTPAAKARTSSTAWPTLQCWKSSRSCIASTARRKNDDHRLATFHPARSAGRWRAHRHRRGDVPAAQRAHRRHQRRARGLLRPLRGDVAWRGSFVLGLVGAPLVYLLFAALPRPQIDAGYGTLILAGLLVGVGTRYGSGCTSGHGVCGISACRHARSWPRWRSWAPALPLCS